MSTRREFLVRGGILGAGAALGAGLARLASLGAPEVHAQGEGKDGPAERTPEGRLKALGLVLPAIEAPRATLVPAVRSGNLLFVSGYGPGSLDGKPIVGKLGAGFNVKQGQDAARRVGLHILAVVRQQLRSLDRVARLVKTLGMVNATPDFTQHPQVINGFSDLMVQVFGEEAGKGARSAVGMSSLPGGIPVEIEAIFEVRPAR